MAWRVFTGLTGEWAWTDQVTGSWTDARRILAGELAVFAADQCQNCRQQGAEALSRLRTTPEGEPFEAEVDGHDYTLSAF